MVSISQKTLNTGLVMVNLTLLPHASVSIPKISNR